MAAQQAPERELSGDDTAHCPCDKSRARCVARRAAGSGGVAVPAAAAAAAAARGKMNFLPISFQVLSSCLVLCQQLVRLVRCCARSAASSAAGCDVPRYGARSTSRGTTGQVAQGCTCRPWCCCAAFARGPSAPARLHATRARRARQRRRPRSQRRRTRRPSGISSGSWKRGAARSVSFE